MSFWFAPEEIEIPNSYVKSVALVLGSLAFVGICIALLMSGELTPFRELVMWFAAVFFTICAVAWLWRLLTHRGAVVTINARGIRDKRIARNSSPGIKCSTSPPGDMDGRNSSF